MNPIVEFVRNLSSRSRFNRWSNFKFLFSGWFSRAGMAIPIIGYAIILGDQTNSFFSLDSALGKNKEFLILSTPSRSKFLYGGLIVILFACIIYFFRSPKVVKNYQSKYSYIENAMNNFSSSEFNFAASNLLKKYEAKLSEKEKQTAGNVVGVSQRGIRFLMNSNEQDGAVWSSRMVSVLDLYFHHEDKSNRASLFVSLAVVLFGYFLVIFPSFDVFQAIIRMSIF